MKAMEKDCLSIIIHLNGFLYALLKHLVNVQLMLHVDNLDIHLPLILAQYQCFIIHLG